MNKNSIFILEDRGILYLNGKDVKEFLQNIISNDIHKVTDSFSCYASLLITATLNSLLKFNISTFDLSLYKLSCLYS